jgi:hypothetical protein
MSPDTIGSVSYLLSVMVPKTIKSAFITDSASGSGVESGVDIVDIVGLVGVEEVGSIGMVAVEEAGTLVVTCPGEVQLIISESIKTVMNNILSVLMAYFVLTPGRCRRSK